MNTVLRTKKNIYENTVYVNNNNIVSQMSGEESESVIAHVVPKASFVEDVETFVKGRLARHWESVSQRLYLFIYECYCDVM